MKVATACNKLDKYSCSGDCKWNEGEYKCDVGDGVNKYTCEHQHGRTLLAIMKKCGNLTGDDCMNDPDCKYEDMKCERSELVFYEKAYGKRCWENVGQAGEAQVVQRG